MKSDHPALDDDLGGMKLYRSDQIDEVIHFVPPSLHDQGQLNTKGSDPNFDNFLGSRLEQNCIR